MSRLHGEMFLFILTRLNLAHQVLYPVYMLIYIGTRLRFLMDSFPPLDPPPPPPLPARGRKGLDFFLSKIRKGVLFFDFFPPEKNGCLLSPPPPPPPPHRDFKRVIML